MNLGLLRFVVLGSSLLVGCGSREGAPIRTSSAAEIPKAAAGVPEADLTHRATEAAAPGARSQPGAEVFPLEADFGSYAVIDAPLPLAEKESEFGCGAELAGRFEPLRSIEIVKKTRLWASTGPTFARSIESTRFLLSLTREGVSDVVVGCGSTLAIDLEPGRYWIRGRARSTQFVEGDEAPGLRGFAVRLSNEGDSTCPSELPLRGIHDWEGEFPFEVTRERIDGDTEPDYRIDYQLAYMNPGTRLVLAAPYPECARVVMDAPASAKPTGTRTKGYRDYVLSYLIFHPIEMFGGRYAALYEGKFDEGAKAYVPGRFFDCRSGYLSETPELDRERDRLCGSSLRNQEKDAFESDLVTRWLDGTAEERRAIGFASSVVPEAASKLLHAVDDEGFRFMTHQVHACAPDETTRSLSYHLELYPKGANHGAFSREAFVLVTKSRGGAPVIAGVGEEEPCPVSDDDGEIEAFVTRYLEAEWSDARRESAANSSLRTVHARLKKAFAEERIETAASSSCATGTGVPGNPTWLYTALVAAEGPKGRDHTSVPLYLLIEKRAGSLVVVESKTTRPAHCGG